ncbi:uncharacterized protein LOC123534008 [Mercenaria mercenaria]|uniref:uncharacterized protein LOC123534008 n=1 Tax=Mercenaria mercenaria TaxID=6596 RepID=UPI00234EE5B8|nr:uncharacterized protein LOC123534008 [Mercenaria mercenaria]XP_045171968.2 uncharacterized protein LOC123534008 [Mercenaria mercenaria]XP_045171969.2 uncharacterized protein LOC123534008 [Mercenaria mercenaria]
MAYLLVCVKTDDTIYDRAVFSKDLAPVKFDTSEMGLALRHDPCTNSAQYFVIHSLSKPRTISGHQHVSGNSGREVGYKNQSTSETSQESDTRPGTSQAGSECSLSCTCSNDENIQSSCKSCDKTITPKVSLVLLDIEYKIVTKLKSDVAYHSFNQMVRSGVFREGFVNFIRKRNKLRYVRHKACSCESVYNACDLSINLPRLLEVCLEPAQADVCYAWNEKLIGLIRKRMILEETMAWLSTLGGGYSSLGDYFEHFSEEAGKLSLTQLSIAVEMGDPVMASKCRLFYALSLMQRGPLSQSKKLIREEYHFATNFKVRDQKLIDMCRGMWSKLRYLYSRRHRRRLSSISCEETATTSTDHHGNLESCRLHDEEVAHIYTQGYIEKFDTATSDTLPSCSEKLATTTVMDHRDNQMTCRLNEIETA